MTTGAGPAPSTGPERSTPADRTLPSSIAALALLSVAAGFIHAAVVDSHRGHGVAAGVFTAIAVFQVAWAGLLHFRPARWVLAVGAGANAAIVGGWALGRTSGIPFIDGFQDPEDVALTDAVATGLEVLIVLGAVILLVAPVHRPWLSDRLASLNLGVVAVVVALAAVPAVSEAGSFHDHGQGSELAAHGDHGHEDGTEGAGHHDGEVAAGHDEAAHDEAAHGDDGHDEAVHGDDGHGDDGHGADGAHVAGDTELASAGHGNSAGHSTSAGHAHTPGTGGDHGAGHSDPPGTHTDPPGTRAAGHTDPPGGHHAPAGHTPAGHAPPPAGHAPDGHADHPAPPPTSPGVTPEQQAAADRLLADTEAILPQWTDEAAHAAGFRTIGDAGTGTEHLLNWAWITDDVVLDPRRPESLVYNVAPDGRRQLAAAMFILPPGTADADIPDIGGTLTQWHIHNNLCFTPEELVDGHPQRRVMGLTSEDGTCARGERLPDAPMLHVWIVDHPCGPFSSLEGVGAGQAIDEAQDPAADPDCQHSTH
jgi:hypothetical protein